MTVFHRSRLGRCEDATVAVVIAFSMMFSLAEVIAAEEDTRPPSVRSALGRILTEDRVASSAYSICERAAKLPDEQRFELLAAFVLPSADHDTLRLAYDMTPTCPAPAVMPVVGTHASEDHPAPPSAPGLPRFSGSEFASPALELIRVATRLGWLPELRNQVTAWKPTGIDEYKAVAAMLSAIACAEKNFPYAEQHMLALLKLTRENLESHPDRTPETFWLWAAAEAEELRTLADELSAILLEDVRRDRPQRNERWKRIVSARRQSLLTPPQRETTTAASPSMWIPVSRMTSETRGAGYPQQR